MIRVRHAVPVARRRMAGLSLIEMMIALVMALIVAAGIISVFASTSSSNKVQQQMAALQEEGRFAIHSLRDDLGNANGTYCSNSGGNAGGTSSGLYLDSLRSPTIYAKSAIAFNDDTVSLPTSTQAYSLPSIMFMRGYDCTTSACNPLDPNTKVATIPAAGKAVGNRVVGSDVLTIRYLKPGSGWAIVPSGSGSGSTISATSGSVNTITLNPLSGEPAVSAFTGTLAMLADCSNAQVFTVSNSSGTLSPNNNYASPLDISQGSAPRVYDFSNDFQTVTYYLKVVCADGSSPCAHTTGALVRRVNGQENVAGAGELVRGVERLDFRYGIIDGNGNTQFLTADQVDSGNGNTIACPPGVPLPDTADNMPGNTPVTGCLWRAVQTVEVHILMDGQTPLYTLTPNEMYYIYTPDGNTPTAPASHTVKPNADQGFPQQLLRREFTTLVALRNFNP
ncbi:MAG: PilW family protein [Xanthomonadales bacterium]|nr:PilW family protein [Xanthomonadales bacterium]ODU91624.1 MAG: hypothetical protein ABT18_15270 [Rhodanobacter sp. SCN 66-43]OJY86568.1 MAG: hypothetical protein BGP23_02940 [Xanthomonadales bacterium 66-474]